jgi:hypothetical protein
MHNQQQINKKSYASTTSYAPNKFLPIETDLYPYMHVFSTSTHFNRKKKQNLARIYEGGG